MDLLFLIPHTKVTSVAISVRTFGHVRINITKIYTLSDSPYKDHLYINLSVKTFGGADGGVWMQRS